MGLVMILMLLKLVLSHFRDSILQGLQMKLRSYLIHDSIDSSLLSRLPRYDLIRIQILAQIQVLLIPQHLRSSLRGPQLHLIPNLLANVLRIVSHDAGHLIAVHHKQMSFSTLYLLNKFNFNPLIRSLYRGDSQLARQYHQKAV